MYYWCFRINGPFNHTAKRKEERKSFSYIICALSVTKLSATLLENDCEEDGGPLCEEDVKMLLSPYQAGVRAGRVKTKYEMCDRQPSAGAQTILASALPRTPALPACTRWAAGLGWAPLPLTPVRRQ